MEEDESKAFDEQTININRMRGIINDEE